MAYQLIALDLDYTLLNNRCQLSRRTKDTIRKAVRKNKIIVLASGRPYAGMRVYYDELGLDTLVIATGGAVVLDDEGNEIYTKSVPPKFAKKVLRYAKEKNIHAQIYIGSDYFFEKHTSFAAMYANVVGYPGREMPDMLKMKEIITSKVLFIDAPEKIMKAQQEIASLFPDLGLLRSRPSYLEINNPDATKGSALAFITERYGLNRGEVIAVGDSELDLSMIEYAGLGVAVENADESIRSRADYVARSNDNDGVAEVIEKFMLGG